MKRGKVWIALYGCLLAFLLAGCEEKAPEELTLVEITDETLYLRSDGTVQSAYLEDFDKDYYQEGELRTFLQEMVDRYNERSGEAVSFTELTVSGGKASAILTYDTLDSYAAFNRNPGEAEETKRVEALAEEDVAARYGSTVFARAGKSETQTGSELFNAKKQQAVVVNGPIQVKIPSDILYYSNGTLLDTQTLQIPQDTEAVIIYKK